jgi:isopentenyldiphosphate isomerase
MELARIDAENLVDRFRRQRGQTLTGPAHWFDEAFGVRVVGADEELVIARKAHHGREHPFVRAMGICYHPTAPHSPWQSGHAERLIGSIGCECLDHVVVFGEAHLREL